jgi:hypothetical protein
MFKRKTEFWRKSNNLIFFRYMNGLYNPVNYHFYWFLDVFRNRHLNIVVQVGQVARADIGLKVGAPSETVQVDIGATDIQVDTTRQTIDGVITSRQITALPLNERNFLDLAVLQPGVTVVDGGVIDPTKTNAFRAVRVNGGSGTGTRVQIEGIDVTDETVGTSVANFSTWRRCVGATDNAVGEALGAEYVKKAYTPEAQKRMSELIDNLFAAYRERLSNLDWMSPETRQKALMKLNA